MFLPVLNKGAQTKYSLSSSLLVSFIVFTFMFARVSMNPRTYSRFSLWLLSCVSSVIKHKEPYL